ncbi:hypothetical protein [Bradyrhizobium sp. B120]|uniref:hypothetical protein n=1 Tax=Bradyrhizobium sp. B120 TaxID=3410088 RepID=UPI003B984057
MTIPQMQLCFGSRRAGSAHDDGGDETQHPSKRRIEIEQVSGRRVIVDVEVDVEARELSARWLDAPWARRTLRGYARAGHAAGQLRIDAADFLHRPADQTMLRSRTLPRLYGNDPSVGPITNDGPHGEGKHDE